MDSSLNTMVLVSCLCLVLVCPFSWNALQVVSGYTHGEFGLGGSPLVEMDRWCEALIRSAFVAAVLL